jgi:hypothetical protein
MLVRWRREEVGETAAGKGFPYFGVKVDRCADGSDVGAGRWEDGDEGVVCALRFVVVAAADAALITSVLSVSARE